MRHDPNEGARYVVTAYRAPEIDGAPLVAERDRLPDARRLANELLGEDIDGDCYGRIEIVCHRGTHRAICWSHTRGESELRLRRALLTLRRSATP